MEHDQGNPTEPETLVGRRVCLRPLEKEDMVCIRTWFSDPEIRRRTGEVSPMTQDDADAFFEKVRTDRNRAWFAIVLKDSGEVIGEAGLLRMFHAWRTTDLSIIIGEKAQWRKGYGTEAITLLLDYAFERLGFHRVAIGVVGFNEAAIRFYESVGFRKEGVQRDGYYCDDRYCDFVMMSLLEDEFREARKE